MTKSNIEGVTLERGTFPVLERQVDRKSARAGEEKREADDEEECVRAARERENVCVIAHAVEVFECDQHADYLANPASNQAMNCVLYCLTSYII